MSGPRCCFYNAFALVLFTRFFGNVLSLWALSDLSQVHEKLEALRARRAELTSAIAILSSAASALHPGRGGVSSAYVSDSTADATGGGATLASVTRSLEQAGRLREQFDRRWGFERDHTLSAALEVSVCATTRMRVGVCESYVSSFDIILSAAP